MADGPAGGRLAAPKGVPEYLPPESAEFLAVRDALSRPAILAGYGYVELPVFEDTALYVRGVGESTDVVSKEMYTFEDRGGRSLSLRPEGTAGVMRSIVENGLHRGSLPVKLWYAGPFFRAERPQHGRYRQLQQVGIEAVGSVDPALDAEVVALADEAYRALGLRDYRLLLTSLGCRDCRPAYRELLAAFLGRIDLDEPTRERARLNPLRVLDDKRAEVQAALTDAPLPVDHLCDGCRAHYDATRSFLADLGVPWEEAPRLVRGLDYYTRTAFEFVHAGLGAQSGIGGGGRYDGLVEAVGGPSMSGIGFGLGVDRTLLACRAEGVDLAPASRIAAFLIPIGELARHRVVMLAGQLRSAGVAADISYDDRSLRSAMKAADRSGAAIGVIVGEDEIAADSAVIRDLRSGEQRSIPMADVVEYLVRATQIPSDIPSDVSSSRLPESAP